MSDDGTESAIGESHSFAQMKSTYFRPLRVWPAVFLLAVMVIARLIPRLVDDGPANLWMSAAFGPIICGLLIVVWWLLISRATWKERIAGLAGIAGTAAVTLFAMDKSMLGPGVMVLTIPMGTAAFGLAAIIFGRTLSFRRTMLAILLAGIGFGFSVLLKSDGMWGDFAIDLHWRWKESREDQILAKQGQQLTAKLSAFDRSEVEKWLMNPEWPGFRGADRTSRQHGPVLSSNWAANPPELMWKIGVGPGWSSFVVAGNLLFTQEQRGSMETVVCYSADSGSELWNQQIESRFDDPLGGPGPQGDAHSRTQWIVCARSQWATDETGSEHRRCQLAIGFAECC